MLNEQLQAYLDGDIGFDDLPEKLRAEARSWDALLGGIGSTAPAGAPLGMDARVMQAIESAGGRRRRSEWLFWLIRPRTISVSPAGALAAVAIVALLVARPWTTEPAAEPGDVTETVYVEFSLEAPGASRVELVGDFNEWAPTISLEDLDGDGVWTANVRLQAGVHEYMFVLDGSDWVTDPSAELTVADGFGQENAVLAIPAVNGT